MLLLFPEYIKKVIIVSNITQYIKKYSQTSRKKFNALKTELEWTEVEVVVLYCYYYFHFIFLVSPIGGEK